MGSSGDDNPTNILPTADSYLIGGQTSSSNGSVKGYHGDFDAWIFMLKNF